MSCNPTDMKQSIGMFAVWHNVESNGTIVDNGIGHLFESNLSLQGAYNGEKKIHRVPQFIFFDEQLFREVRSKATNKQPSETAKNQTKTIKSN